MLSFPKLEKQKWFLPILKFLVALLLAILAGLLLFNQNIFNSLISAIISTGLDPLRARFIAALLMTGATALISTALRRHKPAALIGACLIFTFSFLSPFVNQQLQPILDPGGYPEPLNSSTLVNTSLIMLALAVMSAFIGSAVGVSLARVVFDPPYQLVLFVWQHFIYPIFHKKQHLNTTLLSTQSSARVLILPTLTLLTVLTIFFLISNSGNLFIFSPDVGIHSKPIFTNSTGKTIAGTVIQDSLSSLALQHQIKPFQVYLPPSYYSSIGKKKYYPTLYLLHGSPGDSHDWLTGGKAAESADALIATGKIPELILILPDGNGKTGTTSEWADSFDHHQLIETFLVRDLVKYVDTNYRTLADHDHRAIGGLSMGGFGAMNIAIHHPDTFGSVISLGGYYRAEGPIWHNDPPYIIANSPLDILPSTPDAWQLHMYLGAANKDQPYYADTQQFMQTLDKLHIHYNFDLENGYHGWSVWQKQFYKALQWLSWT